MYELLRITQTKQEARKDCKTINGRDLASICNQKEQDAFDEVAKWDHTWIGLKHEKNQWNWSNGDPFQKWGDTIHVRGGNCVTLNSEYDRKWTAENCYTQSFPVLWG